MPILFYVKIAIAKLQKMSRANSPNQRRAKLIGDFNGTSAEGGSATVEEPEATLNITRIMGRINKRFPPDYFHFLQ